MVSVWALDCARWTRRLATVVVPKRGFISFDVEGHRLEMNAGARSADTALTACNLHLRGRVSLPRARGGAPRSEPVTERLDGDLILRMALAIDSLLPSGALRKAVRAYKAAVTTPPNRLQSSVDCSTRPTRALGWGATRRPGMTWTRNRRC